VKIFVLYNSTILGWLRPKLQINLLHAAETELKAEWEETALASGVTSQPALTMVMLISCNGRAVRVILRVQPRTKPLTCF